MDIIYILHTHNLVRVDERTFVDDEGGLRVVRIVRVENFRFHIRLIVKEDQTVDVLEGLI